MRTPLKIKTITHLEEEYSFDFLPELESIPERLSGVVFSDNSYIRCGFAGHLQSFSLGAYIYLAHNDPESLWEDIYKDMESKLVDGHLDADSLKKPVSLYSMVSYKSGNVEHDEPELHKLVGGARFIGSDYNKETIPEKISTLAKKWIRDNGNYIWAIRCGYYMLEDENFFDDNDKSEWNHLMGCNADIDLPSLREVFALSIDSNDSEFIKKRRLFKLLNNEDVEYVHGRFERMLELCGYEVDSSKMFFEHDYDHLIFANVNRDSPRLEWR